MNKKIRKLLLGVLSIILATLSFYVLISFMDAPFLYYCLNIGIQPPNVIYTPSPECASLWRSTLLLGKVVFLVGLILLSVVWDLILNKVLGKFIR